MQPDRWQTIETLYLSALERADRAAFLDEACGSDTELRDQVERLLRHEVATAVLLQRLGGPDVVGLLAPGDRERLPPDSEFGPYRIVTWLGSGGSSDVYKAVDPRLNRFIALKVFAATTLTHDDRARFVGEARAAASLTHPNIATIYEVGEAANACYIAMEYVDGETLREKMRGHACPLTERLRYLLQAARALEKAHAAGVVHCDLKPENIMVTRDGLVKILDFGLARVVDGYRRERAQASTLAALLPLATTHAGRIEGTVGYMSPEQVEGSVELGLSTDIFSFGCMLFEAATDRLPFWRESVVQSLHSLIYEPAPRLADVARHVPADLQTIVDRCLDKDPARRWPTVADVRERLQRLVAALDRRPSRHWWIGSATAAAIALAGIVFWRQPETPGPTTSIAVIPFVNAQATPERAFLADGLAEGLINTLAELPDMKVIARASSFRFAGVQFDPRQVARTLGVRMLLTGRIVETNDHLVISAQLVDGADGRAMWGADYSANVADLADVQARVAGDIARRVRSRLTPADQRRLAKAAATNPEAYALLLRGRYQMWLYNPASTQQAANYFEQALGIDPGFALAQADLANSYRRMAGAGILKPAAALPQAEQAARRALAADEELAEAHAVLADIKRDQWEWAEAEREYRRALELSASLAIARHGLAIGLSLTGQNEEAVAEAIKARELDPIGLSSAIDSAAVLYNVRRYDEALAMLDGATKMDGSAPAIWTWIGIVRGGRGASADAIDAFDKAIKLGDRTAATLCYYVHALARTGRQREALALLETITKNHAFVPPSSLAIAYVGLDRKDRAFELLESGYAARDPLLQYVFVESHFDALRDDPRFQQMAAKLRLPAR